jgi:hypothetical protein
MFYVYIHKLATDGKPFYVGKGSGKRAWSKQRNQFWKNVANKHGFSVEIVKDGLTEIEAYELEAKLVSEYGRDNLTNLSDGGYGSASGRVVGENEKRLKRERFAGKPGRQWSAEQREAARVRGTGRKHTEEARRKISEAKKGKPQPWSGHSLTEEGRERIRQSKLGKPAPWAAGENSHTKRQEYRDYMSEKFKGVHRPDMVGASNPSARSVVCIDTGQHFHTMKDAAKWLLSINKTSNISASTNINSVCTGKLKSAYGFTWTYAEEYIPPRKPI